MAVEQPLPEHCVLQIAAVPVVQDGTLTIYPDLAAANHAIYQQPCVCVELLGEAFDRCSLCGGDGRRRF